MTPTNVNEATEAVADAINELVHYLQVEKSKSGFNQVCIKASALNVHLGNKQAVTSLYIRI